MAKTKEMITEDLQAALDAEREKVKGLEAILNEYSGYSLQELAQLLREREELMQIQALVREVNSLLKGIIKRGQGGYAGDEDDIIKAISLIAPWTPLTPASDMSIIGKCEPPSQWNPNAQIRNDIS